MRVPLIDFYTYFGRWQIFK
ncbi:hypothetical protein CGLO_14097 [Colletotrichum gloeosporioides Cg-14]|uniref:Uncharacterized protein n=1 Tax=Colletotrichum gloeosporioides (strain Cg-14) TaxID=1237896 RepID=T0LEL7_COLGC|nr:hypothetical protein CGLO_14097 [Colletotrichum gloeosporioides Cg-14]